MVRNIIFDVGNVLIDYIPEEHVRSFGFSEEVTERVMKAVFLSENWADLDGGLGTEAEQLQKFIDSDPEIEKEIRLVMQNPEKTCIEKDLSEAWVKTIKSQGYHIYILSNYGPMWERQQPTWRFYPYFDGAIISYRHKTRKPFAEIYQILLDTYQLKPEECVFLDDSVANIEAARAAGMQGIVVTDHEAAVKGLAELGIRSE